VKDVARAIQGELKKLTNVCFVRGEFHTCNRGEFGVTKQRCCPLMVLILFFNLFCATMASLHTYYQI